MTGPTPAPVELLPTVASSVFEIRKTESAGRGVFATQEIPQSTTIYTTKNTPASVIYRIFRKEVCAWCFAYDSGRTWKVTLELGSSGATEYFCSEACRATWDEEYGVLGKEAWGALEKWLRKAEKEREETVGVAPSEEEIDIAWEQAAAIGMRIVEARTCSAPTKAQRRLIAQHLASTPSPDTGLLLSGILSDALQSILQLEPAPRPYSSAGHLQSHISTYGLLLALLPLPLLPRVTVSSLRAIASVDVRNSFGIYSFPGDSTAEMLGYGIWADASFFNHSCAPNVGTKDRQGRKWHFKVSRPVAKDEELRISYLGREELREMDVMQRRERLRNVWGFECSCERCCAEAVNAIVGTV